MKRSMRLLMRWRQKTARRQARRARSFKRRVEWVALFWGDQTPRDARFLLNRERRRAAGSPTGGAR